MSTPELAAALNSFHRDERTKALNTLKNRETLLTQGKAFNLHCHSFYSYNGYGYSPTALAWYGRQAGLFAMGLVDFDVLDGVEEFLTSCHSVDLRACAGMESRVFVPEFAARVINSPGEPGIAYHMGVGFVPGQIAQPEVLAQFKAQAQARNQGLIARVNKYLAPVEVDYTLDVLPLTPAGNATERHVCMAYDLKAQVVFPDPPARAEFWAEKLGLPQEKVQATMDDSPTFQGLIRGKTMKQGGPGYVRPEGGDFPTLQQFNEFILACEAIPTFAWLDGTSEGEQALDELLDVMVAAGVRVVNLIPDRNWNIKDAAEKKLKVEKMNEFIEAAGARDLPIMAGTEMNAHGQRFVDDFNAPELAPHLPVFTQAVHLLHGHTLLQQHARMGYSSAWSDTHFSSRRERNTFYEEVGRRVGTREPEKLAEVSPAKSTREILARLG